MATVKVSSSIWKENILSNLTSLYQCGLLCDVTIEGNDGVSLSAHANVLAAASPLLKNALEDNQCLLKYADVSSGLWKLLLEFIYTGKVRLESSQVGDVQLAAAKLGLADLLDGGCEVVTKPASSIVHPTSGTLAQNNIKLRYEQHILNMASKKCRKRGRPSDDDDQNDDYMLNTPASQPKRKRQSFRFFTVGSSHSSGVQDSANPMNPSVSNDSQDDSQLASSNINRYYEQRVIEGEARTVNKSSSNEIIDRDNRTSGAFKTLKDQEDSVVVKIERKEEESELEGGDYGDMEYYHMDDEDTQSNTLLRDGDVLDEGEKSTQVKQETAKLSTQDELFLQEEPVRFKRQVHTIQTKYNAIKEVEKGTKSKTQVANSLGIPSNTLSTWLKHKDKIKDVYESQTFNLSAKRMRKGNYSDLESALDEFLRNARANNTLLNGPMLIREAQAMATLLGYTEFRASQGWLSRFKQRKGIHFRKKGDT